MNYNEAKNILDNKHGNKNSKKIANNTYLIRHEANIAVKLHDTDIITFYPKYFVLNNGGWLTMTTKSRISEYSPVYLTQKNSIWYIGQDLYYNGIKIDYSNKIISKIMSVDKKEAEIKKIKSKIKTYAINFTKKLKTGIPLPSTGDCWFCSMRTVENMTLADISKNQDHLQAHMTERYYVPSLLINAFKESGYQYEYILSRDGDKIKSDWWNIQKIITKYMQKRLITV